MYYTLCLLKALRTDRLLFGAGTYYIVYSTSIHLYIYTSIPLYLYTLLTHTYTHTHKHTHKHTQTARFISANIGPEFIDPPSFDLKAVYETSNCKTPLIFVLSPGVDPTGMLYYYILYYYTTILLYTIHYILYTIHHILYTIHH
jgi:hypothetical protein